MSTELEDFVSSLVTPGKIASEDLDHLSIHELEALLGIESIEKGASFFSQSVCKDSGSYDTNWLQQFEGSPLYAKAVQLCESELGLEEQDLQRRIQRNERYKAEAAQEDREDTWTQRDLLRLQKDRLQLELHRGKAGAGGGKDPTMQAQAADAPSAEVEPGKTPPSKQGKTASDIQTVGQVGNGDPNQPEWPRAGLGVDSAGRRATPEEESAQAQASTQVQHREPERGSKTAFRLPTAVVAENTNKALKSFTSVMKKPAMPKVAGLATAVGERVLGRAVSSGAIDKGLVRKGLNAAQSVGARLGGKSTESAVGRGLLAAGGAAAGAGALGAGALASRKKESSLRAAVNRRTEG